MLRRTVILFMLAGLIVPFGFAQNSSSEIPVEQPQTSANQAMPKFDNEMYLFVLITKGPTWTPGETAETKKIQEGHMANINRMWELGKLVAAGPMGDNGDLRGIFIFRGATKEEARLLCAEDPAIKSNRLKIEIFDWFGPRGIGEKYNQEAKKNPPPKVTMVKYFLGLLHKGDNEPVLDKQSAQELQLNHLNHLRQMIDERKIVAAGPIGGNTNFRGLIVLQSETIEQAKAIAEQDPAVKAGRLKVELHPWYVASGVMP